MRFHDIQFPRFLGLRMILASIAAFFRRCYNGLGIGKAYELTVDRISIGLYVHKNGRLTADHLPVHKDQKIGLSRRWRKKGDPESKFWTLWVDGQPYLLTYSQGRNLLKEGLLVPKGTKGTKVTKPERDPIHDVRLVIVETDTPDYTPPTDRTKPHNPQDMEAFNAALAQEFGSLTEDEVAALKSADPKDILKAVPDWLVDEQGQNYLSTLIEGLGKDEPVEPPKGGPSRDLEGKLIKVVALKNGEPVPEGAIDLHAEVIPVQGRLSIPDFRYFKIKVSQ